MRRAQRLLCLVLPLCFAVSVAAAQDCLDFEGFPSQVLREDGAGGPVDDLAVAGRTLYATHGNDLIVFDLPEAAAPVRVLTMDLGGAATLPCASGDLLAVAVLGAGVQLYDISSPQAPALVTTIPVVDPAASWQIRGVALEGDLLVYTEYLQPVRLLDIADPAAPEVLATLDLATVSHAALQGNLLALSGAVFELYDVTDPAAPDLLASRDPQLGCAWEVVAFSAPALHDGIAYAELKTACNWRDPYLYGDPITYYYGIASLGGAKAAAEAPAEKILGGRATREPVPVGDQLFLPGTPGYHEIYDLDGSGGTVRAAYSFPLLLDYTCLVVADGRLAAGTADGLVLTGIPGPETAAYYYGSTSTDSTFPCDLKVAGDLTLHSYGVPMSFEVGPGWFETYFLHRVKAWRDGELVGTVDFGDHIFCGLRWSHPFAFGDWLVTVWGNDCEEVVSAVDLTDPAALADPPYVTLPACTDVERVGDHLLLLGDTAGVRPVALDDPSAPQVLDPVLAGRHFDDFAARGDRLYLREGTGLVVADVADVTVPILLPGEVTVPAGRLKVVGDLLFILDGTTVTWYALAAGDLPQWLGTVDVGTEVRDVWFSDTLIYYADAWGVGLIGMADQEPRGRALVREAALLTLGDQALLVAQRAGSDPVAVPLDCADIVPVFLRTIEATRDGDRATLAWTVAGETEAAAFAVDLRGPTRIADLPVLADGRGGFRAVATVDPADAVTFALYLVAGDERVLLDEKSLQPETPALRTALRGAHPNPFNPRTEVTFVLRRAGPAELAVYDLSGRRVAVLASGRHEAGEHAVVWQGRDAAGRAVPSGSYLVRLLTADGVRSSKLMLLR